MKTKLYYLIIIFNILILLGLSGCVMWSTDYSQIKPINPKHMGTLKRPNDLSILPEFEWKNLDGVDNYDFAIWNALYLDGGEYRLGKNVFFKEKIATNKFQPDVTLESGKAYYWSVRPSGTKNWSKATFQVYANTGNSSVQSKNVEYFLFHTPK